MRGEAYGVDIGEGNDVDGGGRRAWRGYCAVGGGVGCGVGRKLTVGKGRGGDVVTVAELYGEVAVGGYISGAEGDVHGVGDSRCKGIVVCAGCSVGEWESEGCDNMDEGEDND